jgi:acetyl/propionyl-CoA carboxylase alpha subunit
VEHPVTEKVTGLDLVEQQLRIAAGEPLGFSQDEVKLNGHAVEVRVIAEDALTGFLPSSGTIAEFDVPSFVRVDSGVANGSTVPPHYDSLLAKIIAHTDQRSDAIQALAHALQETIVDGVRSNVDLLLSTIEHPAFVDGRLHTGFLAEHAIVDEVATVPAEVLAAVAALDFLEPRHIDDPWRDLPAWRLGRIGQPVLWARAGRMHHASLTERLDGTMLEVTIGDCRLAVRALVAREPWGERRLSVDGHLVVVYPHGAWCAVEWQGRSYRLQRPPPLSVEDTASDRGAGGHTGRLSAPMPGRIVKIAVAPGQEVRSHDPLVVLEAMKMEHVVEAPHAGVVQQVCVEVGQQVAAGALLLELGDEQ